MKKRLVILLVGLFGWAGAVPGWGKTASDPNNVTPSAAEGQAAASKAENEVFAAQKKLVIDSIAQKDIAKADAACEQLLRRFDKDANLPQGVYEVAKAYHDAGQTDKAAVLYRRTIEKWHDTEWAIHSQRDLVQGAIKRKDAQATQTELDKLLTDFARHKDIAGTIYNLGKYYHRSENDVKTALRLHQYNVEHYPGTAQAMYSQVEIVKAQIRSGDETGAAASCDKLSTTFAQQKGLAKEVYQIGAVYAKERQPETAERCYRYVLDHWPEDEFAIRSGLAILDSEAEQTPATPERKAAIDAAFTKLLDVYAKQKTPPKDIYRTAKEYTKSLKERSLKLHQFNSRNSAKDDRFTMWSQTEVAKVYIRDGNEPETEKAVNDLIARFAGQPMVSAELSHIGDAYVQTGKYDRAERVYQYVREHWSRNEETIWAKLGKVRISTAQGDEKTADATYKQLVNDYAQDPNLPQVVMIVGEGYMERGFKLAQPAKADVKNPEQKTMPDTAKAQLQKALAIWAPLTAQSNLVDWGAAAEAQYCTVIVYFRLGEYPSVLDQGSKLLQQWPSYSHNWKVYPLVVKAYKEQMRTDKISVTDGQAAIDQLNKQLLERFPTCPAAAQARKALQASQATASEASASDKGGAQ